MNLMDLVKGQLGQDMIGKVAGMLGESPERAKSGLDAAIPGVLAGLLGASSTKDGADRLMNAVNQHDGGLLGNLGNLLGQGQGNALSQQGGTMLSGLLGGGAMSGLAGAIAKFTGLSSTAVSTLLGLAAPLVMGLLKKQAGASGITSGAGLASMLAGQKQNILGAMPKGLGDALGSVPGMGSILSSAGNSVASTAAAVGQQAVGAARQAAPAGGGLLKFLIPLLLLAAAVWYFFLRTPAPQTPTAPATPAAKAPATPVERLTGDVTGFFGDATRALTGVKDVASAQAAVPAINALATRADTMLGAFRGLAGPERTGIASGVTAALAKLQPIIDQAMAIPGVKDVLGPAVDPLLNKLKSFTP